MKKFTILFILVVFCTTLFSQVGTYTSANSGNWTSPTTWSPPGIPAPGSTVTIDHDVILNTDFQYTSGVITINAGGSLNEDAGRSFVVNGGELYVDGDMDVSNFVCQAGNADITGNLTAHLMYSMALVDNYGTINVDSLQNSGELNTYANAVLNVFRFMNTFDFYNAGILDATDFYNDGDFVNDFEAYLINFTSASWTLNSNYIEFDNFTNTGDFQNDGELFGFYDFTNIGYFEHYGDFNVDNDFLNADTVNGIGAYFYTESLVSVGNNWYNVDTIEGTATAQFCIFNDTGNEGELMGSFDFCDNTPPANPPYIDFNTGNIDVNIVYCNTACSTNIKHNTAQETNVIIYPNPFSEKAKLVFDNIHEDLEINIFNTTGQKIFSSFIGEAQSFEIDSKDIGKGLMLYNISNDKKIVFTGKFIVE